MNDQPKTPFGAVISVRIHPQPYTGTYRVIERSVTGRTDGHIAAALREMASELDAPVLCRFHQGGQECCLTATHYIQSAYCDDQRPFPVCDLHVGFFKSPCFVVKTIQCQKT